MTFNEFNRRLEKCHLDEDTKFLMTHMFEVQIEFTKQLDLTASLISAMADSLQRTVDLHGDTQAKVKELMRGGRPDGVEVYSVRNDPDDDR